MAGMTSFKPYLFTAYYEWLCDNAITPHLAVDCSVKGVRVPTQYIRNNQMVLTLSPAAIQDFEAKRQGIYFKAMFNGVTEEVFVPFKAMLALVAVEKQVALPIGQMIAGCGFDEEELEEEEENLDAPLFENVDEEDEPILTRVESRSEDSGPAFEFVEEDDGGRT